MTPTPVDSSAVHTSASAPAQDIAEALVGRWYRPVRRFFLRQGLRDEESRDLTQETFLRATRAVREYRGEVDAASWIFTIADNVWKNELRRRGAQKRDAETVSIETDDERSAIDPPAAIADPLDVALDRERRARLARAIDELPPRMRRCFVLRYVEHMKYREIADLEQVTENTVKTQMFQARRRLRELLDDDTAFGGDPMLDSAPGGAADDASIDEASTDPAEEAT